MRVDVLLSSIHLVKTRSLAKRLCDAGVVAVEGVPVKSSATVRDGDRITILFRGGPASFVVRIPESSGKKRVQLSKAAAAEYHERVDTPQKDVEALEAQYEEGTLVDPDELFDWE